MASNFSSIISPVKLLSERREGIALFSTIGILLTAYGAVGLSKIKSMFEQRLKYNEQIVEKSNEIISLINKRIS